MRQFSRRSEPDTFELNPSLDLNLDVNLQGSFAAELDLHPCPPDNTTHSLMNDAPDASDRLGDDSPRS